MRPSMIGLFALASAVCLSACTQPEANDPSREFVVRVVNLTPSQSVFETGRFDIPDGELVAGPIGPEQSYRFDVEVHPGAQLQIISMFLESNDAFLAFPPGGIALWTHDGEPIEGERTHELVLYDAGTEIDEPLGEGEGQPLRQSEPGAGQPANGRVSAITDGEDGAGTSPDGVEFPAIAEFVEVHVLHIDGPYFRVVIDNVSPKDLIGQPSNGPKKDEKPALLSPGVFSVHAAGVEWFDIGERVTPQVERLVEDGDPAPLAEQMEYLEGVSSDLSGLVWAVHDGDVALCGVGASASPGLEDLVEDGRSAALLDELAADAAVHLYGLADRNNGSPVIEPGEAVEFRFWAEPGAHLEFVSAYLAANDKFVGACESGIALFDPDGVPRSGDLGWAVDLFDAGTEVDEPPGLGTNQFERQPRSGAGADEGEVVREVRGPWMGWEYPMADQIISVEVEVSSSVPAKPDDGIPGFP